VPPTPLLLPAPRKGGFDPSTMRGRLRPQDPHYSLAPGVGPTLAPPPAVVPASAPHCSRSATSSGAGLCRSKGGAKRAGARRRLCCAHHRQGPPLPEASPLASRTRCEEDRWAGKEPSCTNALYRPTKPTCRETNPPVHGPEQQSTLPRCQPGGTAGGGPCRSAPGPPPPSHCAGGGDGSGAGSSGSTQGAARRSPCPPEPSRSPRARGAPRTDTAPLHGPQRQTARDRPLAAEPGHTPRDPPPPAAPRASPPTPREHPGVRSRTVPGRYGGEPALPQPGTRYGAQRGSPPEAGAPRTAKHRRQLALRSPTDNRKRSVFGCISFGNEPNWQLDSKSSKSLYKEVSYKMYRNVLKKKKTKHKPQQPETTPKGEQRRCETTAEGSGPRSGGQKRPLDNTLKHKNITLCTGPYKEQHPLGSNRELPARSGAAPTIRSRQRHMPRGEKSRE